MKDGFLYNIVATKQNEEETTSYIDKDGDFLPETRFRSFTDESESPMKESITFNFKVEQ
jgi:hypothetical protein